MQRADQLPAAPSAARGSKDGVPPSGVRGTDDMVLAALTVNGLWTSLCLGKWTFSEAPSWGFALIAAALTSVQLALRATHGALPAAVRREREPFVANA